MIRPAAAAATALCLATLACAPTAGAARDLHWTPCAKHVQCATATVPRDYGNSSKGTFKIPLSRVPATRPNRRVGSLFLNFGGPGGGSANRIMASGHKTYRALNRRYDLIGFDPRGTSGSRPAIDCHTNGEAASKPLPTPSTPGADLIEGAMKMVDRCMHFDDRRHILRYVTTGNVARDLNRLRAAVGDRRLNYLGYSYGTAIGATFQTFYPERVGKMVLDGPVNLHSYFHQPLNFWVKQARSSQDVLDGFLRACKRHQNACSGFGGQDPTAALRTLLRHVRANPLPAEGSPSRPVDGDDLLAAINWDVFGRPYWGELARALRDAEKGDGTLARELADYWWGRGPGGTYDPGLDANVIITTVDQAWPDAVGSYLDAVRRAYRSTKYLWWIGGSTSGYYANVVNGLFSLRPDGGYRGPFENAASSPTTLVVGTTHDPLTPYEGARAEVRQLGNARLLTMKGYIHTAYPDNSRCINRAVNAYLKRGVLPREDKVCRQHVPFERFKSTESSKLPASVPSQRPLRPDGPLLP